MGDDGDENAKAVVRNGYDNIAETYLNWSVDKESPRLAHVEQLLSMLPRPSDARVLELGCGAGIPSTKVLAEQCREVVANDVSDAQLKLAKENVPADNVQFVRADMAELDFDPSSLDAVVAFYSIIHLPRKEQLDMFQKIWTWLVPGGYIVCNVSVEDNPGATREWLGSPMYWSSFDAETNVQRVHDAGFDIITREILWDDEDGRSVPFLWLVAKKK
jgi:SAM-dependent methyltransferase